MVSVSVSEPAGSPLMNAASSDLIVTTWSRRRSTGLDHPMA